MKIYESASDFFSKAYPKNDLQFTAYFMILTSLLGLTSWLLIPLFFWWIIGFGVVGIATIAVCSGDGSIRRLLKGKN